MIGRNRVDQLEPFDEYAEWALKCSHYVLGVGGQGAGTAFVEDFAAVALGEDRENEGVDKGVLGKEGEAGEEGGRVAAIPAEWIIWNFEDAEASR